MTKRKKILMALLICFSFLIMLNSNKAYAASASITASQTVTQGSSVTITGSVTAGAWNLVLEGNGTSKSLVGQTSTTANQSASTSITFTASNVGTYNFTLTGDMTDYSSTDYVPETVNKSCTVTVVAASSSSDSSSSTTTSTSAPTLSNLGITPYDFSGFKSGTTSYSVTVPNSCTSVTIYANTNSSGATISGTGTVTLKEGTNKYTVTVSNSAGSKSYTISIIRQSEENEIVANSSDEETEDSSEGIGLDSLSITGYELNEEFNINTYEYTVTLSEEITEELLEEIKSKIFWTANSEDVNVEYEIEVSEDGTSGTITLIVKDDEKEYSRYVITFSNSEEVIEDEEDDEKTVAVAGTTSSNNSDGGTTGLDSTTKKVIALIGCIIISGCFGIYFAVSSYVKSQRLLVYEPKDNDDIDEQETENIVESIMEERGKQEEKIPAMQNANLEKDLELEESNPIDLAKDSAEKLSELGGYRKMRKGFSSGRH